MVFGRTATNDQALAPLAESRSVRGRRSAACAGSLLLAAAMLAGCSTPAPAPAPAPAPPPPPPASSTDVSQVQADLQQHDHGARAGSVVRVLNDDNLAAVVLAPSRNAQPIRVNDFFTFTDPNRNPIANGKVVTIENGIIVINYAPTSGGRAPQEGDIAIHLSGMGM